MSNTRLIKILDILSYVFILATVVLVPLVIDKNLVNFYILPKQYIFMGLLLFNILFFIIKITLSRRFHYRQSVLDIPLLILLVVALLSSLFSNSLYNSFLGRNEYFLLNFVFLLFAILFYFILINSIDSYQRWRTVIDVWLSVGGLTAILFILKTVFSFDLPWVGAVWNVVDGSNTAFGLWMIVIMMLSAGQLMKKGLNISQALFYFFILILSIIPLLAISFKVLWWVVLIGLLLLLLLGVSFVRQVRAGWLSVLFAILVITSIFIIFGSPKSLQSKLPLELSLSFKTSWSVASQTFFSGAKNFLLGSGLGSFSTDFSKYRTNSFNYDSLAWSLRFNHPFNVYLAILAEGGIVLSLGFLIILFLVIGQVLSAWFHKRQVGFLGQTDQVFADEAEHRQTDLDVYLLLIVWLVLWISMAVNFFGPVMWFTWWLVLGLIVSGLHLGGHQVIKFRSWTLEDIPQYNLAFSFSLIVVMAVVVMFGILGIRFYWAEVVYASALSSTDYKLIDSKLQESITLRKNYDIYHVAQAMSYLNQAGQQAKTDKADMQTVANLVAAAVNQARLATQLSPNAVATWENLSVMYENASVLVPEAGSWAIKSLQTAIGLEPSNASLHWRLANNYVVAKDNNKAIEYYKKAIDLKTDYASAYTGLAQVYEINKELDKAIDSYKILVQGGNRNVDILYQYGRLLYNRNKLDDRKDAEQLWLTVIEAQPKHSNTLYSLGLLYEAKNEKEKALQYYYKVKDLNPNNQDLSNKINSLLYIPVQKSTSTASGN